jgi:hypothetical protein
MHSVINQQWQQRFLAQQAAAAANPVPANRIDEAAGIRISGFRAPDALVPGTPVVLEFTCLAEAGPVDPRGNVDLSGWIRLCVLIRAAGFSEVVEQELESEDGHCFHVRVAIAGLPRTGDYQLDACISCEALTAEAVAAASQWNGELTVQHPPARAAARKLLHGVEDLRNGWQHLKWFGYFLDDKFPWVYHADHEWLYFRQQPQSDGCLEVLDAHLGWLLIDPHTYPQLTVAADSRPLRFLRREGSLRVFTELEGGAIQRVPTNKPADLKDLSV